MAKTNNLEEVTIPETTKETLNRTLQSLEELDSQLPQFLSLSDPDLLSELPLLQRAHSLFKLAKLTSTLFSLKLRCKGININDHPFKSELDRLSVFQKRLENLPILSEEQWQDMMNKSREEEEPTMNDQEEHAGQKRKHPSSDAKEFQGSNSKETIVIDISDDDEKIGPVVCPE